MSVIINQRATIFKMALDLFKENTDVFLKLLLFFAPLIICAHITGALLDPYFTNAEQKGRLVGLLLLLCGAYTWLKILIERRKTLDILKDLNLELLCFVLLAALYIYLPFALVDATEWALQKTRYIREFRAPLISILNIMAAYFVVRQIFVFIGFVDGQVISPLKSIRMSSINFTPLLWNYALYILPYSFFILLYTMGTQYADLNWDIAGDGVGKTIFFYVLYSPVFIFLHPLMGAVGITTAYVFYRQSLKTEDQPEQ